MKFEIGKDQFVSIGRAADALANRLDGGMAALVQLCVQSGDLIRLRTGGELADVAVWLPVHFHSALVGETKEVDFDSSSIQYVAGRGRRVLLVKSNESVLVSDVDEDDTMCVLNAKDSSREELEEVEDGDLNARIPLQDLCEMLERVLWVAGDADRDDFKCVWMRFREDEISVLATNKQLAVCARSRADVRFRNMKDICFDLSCMRAIYFLSKLWSKRTRAVGDAYCSIYWSVKKDQFLFDLSGCCIEATVLVSELANSVNTDFMGGWEKYKYRKGAMFNVEAESFNIQLAHLQDSMATAGKKTEAVDILVKNRRMYFYAPGEKRDMVKPMVLEDPVWCDLPKHQLTCNMCPSLLRKVLEKEKGVLKIELPIDRVGTPIPYYVTLKNNKNIRYTLMPASRGCHE